MNGEFFGITWGALENFIYSPLLIIAFILLLYKILWARTVVGELASPLFQKRFVVNFSFIKAIFRLILMMVGLLFLFIALLRPQWDKKEETVTQEGRDVFIALDISRSMLAQDMLPNRLEWAKAKIRSLLNLLESDRVGLILFSGSTFVQCPLTADTGAFNMYLDQIDVDTISSGSTAIDQAIKEAMKSFKGVGERKNKLLVLFTDGEDFSSNLRGVKEEAIKEGLSIFAVGVGTKEGAPIPLFDDQGRQKGHQLDKQGNVVITRINEGILRNLAHDSGGTFIAATSDDRDIKTVVNKAHEFEKEKIDEKKVARYEDQYPYFLAVSFGCFALEWLL